MVTPMTMLRMKKEQKMMKTIKKMAFHWLVLAIGCWSISVTAMAWYMMADQFSRDATCRQAASQHKMQNRKQLSTLKHAAPHGGPQLSTQST